MKGYSGAAAAPAAKRRWSCFAVTVPVVVFLSLIGTVSVLLGLHTRFPIGFNKEESSSPGSGFLIAVSRKDEKPMENDELRIKQIVDKFKLDMPQTVISKTTARVVDFQKDNSNSTDSEGESLSPHKITMSQTKPEDTISKDPPNKEVGSSETPSVSNTKDGWRTRKNIIPKGSDGDAAEKSCHLKFGSYCLWSIEHREVMKDSMVKKLKDQLFVARSYYPSIAKLRGQQKLSREMKQNIQEYEHMLSEAISDPELPSFVEKKLETMDRTISKAKLQTVECHNVDKKLRQILDLTEDEAQFHTKQSAFLHRLGVQTMPKSHHCMSMRLTVEYFRAPLADLDQSYTHKLDNPSYQQYVVFSRNLLAASVAINSTVMNSEETKSIVFNVLTDADNFYSMKLWFGRNSYKEAVVHVVNADDLKLNQSYGFGHPQLSTSEEFRVSVSSNHKQSAQINTEYISLFGHSHFLLPEIFKNLKKVVVLDDDVVVQRDLSPLWNTDLNGKVNGAIQFCGLRLGQMTSYLGNDKNDNSCAWMSGLNVLDLEKWRALNVTGIYQEALQKFYNGSEASWRAAAFPTSLIAFRDLIFPLDDSWIISGLGYNYGIDADTIHNSRVLHYNGNMKPWLDLGIPKYKNYWKKFLVQDPIMDQCNVNH